MGKLIALFKLFQLGSQVADPAKWKARQVDANMLSVFLLALVNIAPLFGIVLPFMPSPEVINMIAGSILGVVNTGLTIVTTSKLGVIPSSTSDARTTLIPGIVASTDLITQSARSESDSPPVQKIPGDNTYLG